MLYTKRILPTNVANFKITQNGTNPTDSLLWVYGIMYPARRMRKRYSNVDAQQWHTTSLTASFSLPVAIFTANPRSDSVNQDTWLSTPKPSLGTKEVLPALLPSRLQILYLASSSYSRNQAIRLLPRKLSSPQITVWGVGVEWKEGFVLGSL